MANREAFNFVHTGEPYRSALELIPATPGKPTNNIGENTYFYLPEEATLDYKPLTPGQEKGWMKEEGISGVVTITPPIRRVTEYADPYRVSHQVHLDDFPASGGRDGYFYEDGTARPTNLNELIGLCVEQFGWVVSGALQKKLASLSPTQ